MWAQLLDKLDARRKKLDHSVQLQRVFGEIFYLRDWIEEIKVLTCTYSMYKSKVHDTSSTVFAS